MEEVESDMSAFHRVDDVRAMPALRFINFAMRLVAYKGIVRALAETEKAESATPQSAPRAAARGGTPRDRVVPSDAYTLTTDPAFAGQIEVRQTHA
jgi:hypothetical protein